VTTVPQNPATVPARAAAPVRGAGAFEEALLGLLLLLMPLIPTVEFLGRRLFGAGIPDAADYLRHLTLWVGFLGAMVATRDDRHLKLVHDSGWVPERIRAGAVFLGTFVSAAVAAGLFVAALQLVLSEAPALPAAVRTLVPGFVADRLISAEGFTGGNAARIGGWLPVWVAESIMAVGFLVIAARFVFRAPLGRPAKIALAAAVPLAVALAAAPAELGGWAWAGWALLLVAGAFGAPIFVLLGGVALLLFRSSGVTIASVPAETYRIVASPIFPTIPIFTIVGILLSEGGTSMRLVRLVRALFGPVPGGAAVAATLLCTFFTTFTGASGVTILALGGLLLPVLVGSGYPERFSVGLLTASGSMGLLLPPSLVVILYGVVAHVPINALFEAGILPGMMMLLPVLLMCWWEGRAIHAARQPFQAREALAALWGAKGEVLLPVAALVLIFSGICTLVEASAILAVLALIVVLAHRELRPGRLLAVFARSGTLVGSVLIILGVAMGLTSYLVDAQVPMRAAEWVSGHLHARWVFLLALNGALLVVGCLMDIYSALVVVVPLILPMAALFGVDPLHLGVIFLANLQLGYLTPPVGMNLFLASLTLERPFAAVIRGVLPFLLVLAVVVLVITYVPWLSTGAPALLH
jgi:C4-dicarboxylate transporter, DctM subunit